MSAVAWGTWLVGLGAVTIFLAMVVGSERPYEGLKFEGPFNSRAQRLRFAVEGTGASMGRPAVSCWPSPTCRRPGCFWPWQEQGCSYICSWRGSSASTGRSGLAKRGAQLRAQEQPICSGGCLRQPRAVRHGAGVCATPGATSTGRTCSPSRHHGRHVLTILTEWSGHAVWKETWTTGD